MPAERFTVLVIDDDEETRSLYAEVFQDAGFRVREAKDGLEGLQLVDREKPDVIFTGIIMPRMDGFMLVETLKKNVVTAAIPILFSSHLGREEDQRRAKELGAQDFIVRDITPITEVVRRIQVLLTSAEYCVELVPKALDAQKLAEHFGLNANYLCGENGDQRLVLKLRVKDIHTKSFDAEFVCM